MTMALCMFVKILTGTKWYKWLQWALQNNETVNPVDMLCANVLLLMFGIPFSNRKKRDKNAMDLILKDLKWDATKLSLILCIDCCIIDGFKIFLHSVLQPVTRFWQIDWHCVDFQPKEWHPLSGTSLVGFTVPVPFTDPVVSFQLTDDVQVMKVSVERVYQQG